MTSFEKPNPVIVEIIFDPSAKLEGVQPGLHFHQQCLELDCPHAVRCQDGPDGHEVVVSLSCYGDPSDADWEKLRRYSKLGCKRATQQLHAEMDANRQAGDFANYAKQFEMQR